MRWKPSVHELTLTRQALNQPSYGYEPALVQHRKIGKLLFREGDRAEGP